LNWRLDSDIVGPDRDSEVESQNQLPHYLERQAIKNEVQMMLLASRNGESDSRRGYGRTSNRDQKKSRESRSPHSRSQSCTVRDGGNQKEPDRNC
jgi:hypothetical protein